MDSGCDDKNPCTADVCRAGRCQRSPAAASVVCRPAAGPCDVAELCDGTTSACPADSLRPPREVCRPAAGPCDLAEVCSGREASCPAADAHRPRGTLCRASAGPCDADETCDGVTARCPDDGRVAAGSVCRGASPPLGCDEPEICDGRAISCPGDSRGLPIIRAAPGCTDGIACPAGRGDCDANRENSCETDLNTLENCGRCGTHCGRLAGPGLPAANQCDGFGCGFAPCPFPSPPAGFYGDRLRCHACPRGTANPTAHPQGIGPAACVPCPSGTYADQMGSAACTPCPPLHTSPPGSSSVDACRRVMIVPPIVVPPVVGPIR